MDTIENPITGEKIRIAKKEFPETMTWSEAKKNCASLGDGWRLPTKEELEEMFLHKSEIGDLKGWDYWSCTEDDDIDLAYFYSVAYGEATREGKNTEKSVRAVKPL